MFAPHNARRPRKRAAQAMVATGSALLTVALVGSLTNVAGASSHREAPLIADDPVHDNTDTYAFVSPDDPSTVTLIANWSPFSEPNGGPNFYPWEDGSWYDIHIDSNGDALPDITYRWTFTTDDQRGTDTFLYNNGPVTSLSDETLLFKQSFTLTKIAGEEETEIASGPVAPSNVGPASMPDYSALRDEAITDGEGGGQTYAGQADDPFFLDLRVFDLIYGGDLSETGVDTLAGYNVNSVALQVPIDEVALSGDSATNPVVGVWSTTSKQSLSLEPGAATPEGDYVQVSRLGNPLVNEVVIPAGLKDAFNGLTPDQDATVADGAVLDKVLDPELAQLIEAIYGIPAPETPREDIQQIFLTGIAKSTGPIQADLNSQVLNGDVEADAFVPSEMLRLNLTVPPTAEPSRLGVLAGDLQGFPNGRRLADDVVDIEIQAIMGAAQSGELVQALATGDGVDNNTAAFGDTFPYLALPNTAAVNQGEEGSTMPGGGVSTGFGGTATDNGLPSWVLLTGAGSLVLMGVGAGSLLRGRRERLAPTGPGAVA
ncbi:MAG: DUF4331 domain-containing protein [Ornithinimicrobium sp.]|uniref:DUF4331 domain-containing protein n=1 Tax=Ornithinimicrobium sp. TaxID=1977084 RepID=UPI003D9B5BB2